MSDSRPAEAMSSGPDITTPGQDLATKTCSLCKRSQPITEFYRNKRAKDGRWAYCRSCGKVYKERPLLERRENEAATRKRLAKVQFWWDNPLLSLAECAERLGITEKSLNWAVRQEDPDRSRRIARRQRAAEIRAEEEYLERLRNASPCLVCGEYVLRGPTFKTCSHECAELWRKGRVRLSEEEHEKHRVHVAKSILRNPEKRKDVEIRWAKRMLSDNPPPPTRRYEVEGSEASEAEDEARKRNRETMRRLSPKPQKVEDDGPFIDWTEVAS